MSLFGFAVSSLELGLVVTLVILTMLLGGAKMMARRARIKQTP